MAIARLVPGRKDRLPLQHPGGEVLHEEKHLPVSRGVTGDPSIGHQTV